MRIQQFGGSFTDYESLRPQRIPSVSAEEVKRQDEKRAAEENALTPQALSAEVPAAFREEQEGERPGRSADLENISLSFHKEETYDYIGQDKDIRNLDMEKAISDMKKDSVLQEYQYFVGSAAAISGSGLPDDLAGDGLVFLKGPEGF